MMGEDLASARISIHGILGDRSYAFVDRRNEDEKFPWMTARQSHDMILFKPRWRDIESGMLEVATPEDRHFSDIREVSLLEFLQARFQRELNLVYNPSGVFDSGIPISLIGLQTVRRLSEESSISSLERERFRANVYADWSNGAPFYEDELVGREIALGESVNLRVERKNSRCVIPTLNPSTAVSSPTLLSQIKAIHGGCTGVYARVTREGEVRVGDPIYLSD
jgi:uncharacterized protein YcbX